MAPMAVTYSSHVVSFIVFIRVVIVAEWTNNITGMLIPCIRKAADGQTLGHLRHTV